MLGGGLRGEERVCESVRVAVQVSWSGNLELEPRPEVGEGPAVCTSAGRPAPSVEGRAVGCRGGRLG